MHSVGAPLVPKHGRGQVKQSPSARCEEFQKEGPVLVRALEMLAIFFCVVGYSFCL